MIKSTSPYKAYKPVPGNVGGLSVFTGIILYDVETPDVERHLRCLYLCMFLNHSQWLIEVIIQLFEPVGCIFPKCT